MLTVSIALAPVSAQASQSGSQTSSGNTNNMASMLSSAVSVVSMAAGALSMYNGIQQMSCCMQGCSGAGTKATGDKAKTDAAAKTGAEAVKVESAKRIVPEFFKRFPDSASLDGCPLLKGTSSQGKLNLMIQFFRPQRAEAGGCADAALAMATGGLMLLTGMMGMMGAKQAAKNADTSYNNAGGLGNYGSLGTSGVDSGTSGSSLNPNASGASGGNGTGNGVGTGIGSGSDGSNIAGAKIGNGSGAGQQPGIKVDPALLRNGKADVVMSKFEKQFGLDRDDFANAVAGGEDPRELLANAPKNAMSMADMNKATGAANNMSDSEKQSALAASELADIQKEFAANSKLGSDDNAYAAGGKAPASSPRKLSSETLDDLGLESTDVLGAASLVDPAVSPAIRDALQRREEELSKKSHVDTSLFEVVHRKYKEKYPMISGAGIKAGVGNAD